MGNTTVSTKDTTIPSYKKIWSDKTAPDAINTVYGIMSQVQQYATYNPECSQCNGQGCDLGECSAFTDYDHCSSGGAGKLVDATGIEYTPTGHDYTSYVQSCACSSKPICSRANIESCWLGPGSSGEEPTYRADWSNMTDPLQGAHKTDIKTKLKCSYDINKIDKLGQIYTYNKLFNPDPNDPSYYEIMRKYCSKESTQCLIDPITNKSVSECSKVTASLKDPDAQVCRLWYNGLNDTNRDSFIDYVCQDDSKTECKCAKRGFSEDYKAFQEAVRNKIKSSSENIIPDSCWYMPCKSNDPVYLVGSSDIHNSTNCPKTICQTIYNVDGTIGNVTIENNKNYIACVPPKKDEEPDKPAKPAEEIVPKEPVVIPPIIHDNVTKVNNRPDIGWIVIAIISLLSIVVILYNPNKK